MRDFVYLCYNEDGIEQSSWSIIFLSEEENQVFSGLYKVCVASDLQRLGCPVWPSPSFLTFVGSLGAPCFSLPFPRGRPLISSVSLPPDFLCGASMVVCSLFQVSSSPRFCLGLSVKSPAPPGSPCLRPSELHRRWFGSLFRVSVSRLPPWRRTVGGSVGTGCGRVGTAESIMKPWVCPVLPVSACWLFFPVVFMAVRCSLCKT